MLVAVEREPGREVAYGGNGTSSSGKSQLNATALGVVVPRITDGRDRAARQLIGHGEETCAFLQVPSVGASKSDVDTLKRIVGCVGVQSLIRALKDGAESTVEAHDRGNEVALCCLRFGAWVLDGAQAQARHLFSATTHQRDVTDGADT